VKSVADAQRILAEAIRGSSLIERESRGLVLLSGGPDSVALLAGLAAWQAESRPLALHVNYGLRAESDADQAVCAEVCDRLGIELVVIRAGSPEGNIQAWARERRYEEAETLRRQRGLGWIAVGHTMSDVAETVIYRLVSSPGRRSLAAMRPRNGRVLRPLLSLTRAETRELATATGLPFADDLSNQDPAFSRARIRAEVLPPLLEINPGAVANVALTRAELIEEGDLLEDLAGRLLEGVESGGTIRAAALTDAHPALRRLALRQFTERELGRQVSLSLATAAAIWRIANDPEGGRIDLGSDDSLVVESGLITVESGTDRTFDAGPVELRLPGTAAWGGWWLSARTLEPPFTPRSGLAAALDLEATGTRLRVRGWQPGDRIQPLGMKGSKTLQDLFTDAGIPRSKRHRTPVMLAGDRIVWVAGVAVAEPFRLRPSTRSAICITATPE